MKFSTKIALYSLLLIIILVTLSKFFKPFQGRALGIMVDLSSYFEFDFVDQDLNKIIKGKLQGQKGEFAVVITDLSSGERKFSINEDKPFPAASLYKLFLLAAAFEEIENGRLKEDQVITVSQEHLKKVLGFEDFGYNKDQEEISHKVSSILSRIATISDNYASIMLAEKIGWEKVREQARKIGASQTSIKDPITTSASDIALYFEKLYRGEIVSKQASEKIIELLSKSKINNRIPSKLPADVEIKEGTQSAKQVLKIAHKTAELPRIRHDGGIVFIPGKPYAIVLLSQDLQFEDDGIELLGQISKDVFDYFSKK